MILKIASLHTNAVLLILKQASTVVMDILCCKQAAARPGFLRSGLLLRWGGEAARSGQAFPSLVSVECGYCGAGSRQAAV